MKYNLLLYFLLISTITCFSQRQTYDLISFVPPKNWEKEVKAGTYTCYTVNNREKNTYCRIFIMSSIDSKGGVKESFDTEWQTLIASQYTLTQPVQLSKPGSKDGWETISGTAAFSFNNGSSTATLNAYNGFGKTLSIVTISNSPEYKSSIAQFLASLQLKKPAAVNNAPTRIPVTTSTPAGTFTFTTTNFDDGWTSIEKTDWVEVSKGTIKVLLHYPKEGTIFPADPEPLTNAAWNILVAPRYSHLKNYRTAYITTYERPYLGFGDLMDNATGKEVFVVLFRQGASGWIEIIAPDKNSFIQTFRFDPYTINWNSETSLMDPLLKLAGYNKFGVAAADLTGTWTSDFSGMQQLYSVYTGQYAGMNINQSSQTFDFGAGNSYNWKILVVNGMVGSMKYGQAKSSGKFTVVSNWQVSFSDIEGKLRLYDVYFSSLKGARILWVNDAKNPGSGVFTGFGKK